MKWIARAPTSLEVSMLAERLIKCIKYVELATLIEKIVSCSDVLGQRLLQRAAKL